MISCLSVQGTKQVIGIYGGRLHLSTNTGSTWTEIQPAGDENKNWQCVALSANGMVIIAGIYGGRLYMSTNTGSTWSEIRPIDDADYNWVRVTASTDGSIIFASNEKRLWRSTNSGSSWSEIQPVGNFDRNWQAICAAPNGTSLIVGDASPGRLWYSANTGTTWIEVSYTGGDPLGDKVWQDINGDGIDAFSGRDNKRIYQGYRNWDPFLGPVDTIFWPEMQALGDVDKNWRISSPGNIDYLEAIFGGRIYFAMGGTDPLEILIAGDADKNWNCVYSGGIFNPGVACEGNNLYVTPDVGSYWNPWTKHHFGPDATLTISFSETAGLPDGSAVPPYLNDTVDANESLSILAVPNETYLFDNWSIISGTPTIADPDSTSTYVTLLPNDIAEIRANFHKGEVLVSLTIQVDGQGSTDPTGTTEVSEDTQIPVLATPDPGNNFVNWAVISGTVTINSSTSASTYITISPGSGDATIQANFESAAIVISGSATLNDSSRHTVNPGRTGFIFDMSPPDYSDATAISAKYLKTIPGDTTFLQGQILGNEDLILELKKWSYFGGTQLPDSTWIDGTWMFRWFSPSYLSYSIYDTSDSSVIGFPYRDPVQTNIGNYYASMVVPETPGHYGIRWVYVKDQTGSIILESFTSVSRGIDAMKDYPYAVGMLPYPTVTPVTVPIPLVATIPTYEYKNLGETAVFTLQFNGPVPTPIDYHWRMNDNNLVDDATKFSGVLTDTLTVYNVSMAEAGSFTCVVSDQVISSKSWLVIDIP